MLSNERNRLRMLARECDYSPANYDNVKTLCCSVPKLLDLLERVEQERDELRRINDGLAEALVQRTADEFGHLRVKLAEAQVQVEKLRELVDWIAGGTWTESGDVLGAAYSELRVIKRTRDVRTEVYGAE